MSGSNEPREPEFHPDDSMDDANEESEGTEGPQGSKGAKLTLPPPTKVSLTEKITKLRGAPKKKEFASVDIEAEDWVNPYAVGFYAAGRFYSFEAPLTAHEVRHDKRSYTGERRWEAVDAFLKFFLDKRWTGIQVFAHNGGNYDFLFFLRRLVRGPFHGLGYKVEVTPIQSCMFKLTITHPDVEGKWVLLDSTRLLPMALDDLGERLGVGRKVELHKILRCKKDDIYTVLARPSQRTEMLKYLAQDCKVLHKGIDRYQSIVNAMGGEMKATTPSTSMDLFRRVFLTRDVYRNRHFHTCPDLGKEADDVTCLGCGHAYIRQALAGGRTEIFTMESPPGLRLIYVDMNSMYPYCMLEPMPSGMATVIEVGGTHEQVMKSARTQVGIVACDVYVPEDTYLPPLPVRWDGKTTSPKTGGKLVFPTGHFSGTWDTVELKLLDDVGGRIEKVHKQAWFAPAPLFGDFINRLFEFRDRTRKDWDAAWDSLAKLFMNSNFGKWAQREERTEIVIGPDIDKLTLYDEIDFGSDVWSRDVYVEADHIAPQLSVHVTALARSRLWKMMRKLLAEGAELYYCDTDSIVYAPADPTAAVKSSKKLGEMKVEHYVEKAEFVLPKLYHLLCAADCPCQEEAKGKGRPWERNKLRAKGLGPGLGAKLTMEDWERLTALHAPGESRAVTRRRLAKFKESVHAYFKNNIEFPRVKLSEKEIKSAYDKRDILSDGARTMPLILNVNARIIRGSDIVRENTGKS